MLFDGPVAGHRTFVQKTLFRRKSAVLVARRVGLLLGRRQLIELLALSGQPHATILVGQVEFVAVPAELPGDHDVNDAGMSRHGTYGYGRETERPGDAGHRARVL